jgi:N-acetylglutamate synthase-like GNAT family acetyltransferase
MQMLKQEAALRSASAEDLERVNALLAACELPGVTPADQIGDGYVLAETHGAVVGIAGMEIHGDSGLLRSVAVAESMRSRGLGDVLVRNRMRWANDRGVSAVYLLTTTAADYFARRGFVAVDRDAAPAPIKASREFKDVCPSSATFMIFTEGGVR